MITAKQKCELWAPELDLVIQTVTHKMPAHQKLLVKSAFVGLVNTLKTAKEAHLQQAFLLMKNLGDLFVEDFETKEAFAARLHTISEQWK